MQSLAALVRSYLDDREVDLVRGDPLREARTNTWTQDLSCVLVDEAAVVTAFRDVAAGLRRRFEGQPGPATFYVWCDEQAGQLRFSLASAPPDRLPFGQPYSPGGDAAVAEHVLRTAAQFPHPGVIPWGELTPTGIYEGVDEAEPDAPLTPISVWVHVIR